ncbi:hypothetical protein L3X38_036580 [Prunus dulcis]|uniref:Uncharacterized protein n=1 Tax=Prunus dulcis TaxID=3755 RepID=A0AAD4V2T7_PRUDU|nr:hypothetical protein L3X38_036580 [Prunus dulcis]
MSQTTGSVNGGFCVPVFLGMSFDRCFYHDFRLPSCCCLLFDSASDPTEKASVQPNGRRVRFRESRSRLRILNVVPPKRALTVFERWKLSRMHLLFVELPLSVVKLGREDIFVLLHLCHVLS